METKTFQRTDYGWCIKKRKIVSVKDTCENYVHKKQYKIRRSGIQRYLDNILTGLATIKCVIEEEMNERNEMQKLQ